MFDIDESTNAVTVQGLSYQRWLCRIGPAFEEFNNYRSMPTVTSIVQRSVASKIMCIHSCNIS